MSENKQYITAVFEYDAGAKFPKELTAAFASRSSKFKDVKIVAVSLEDEISRVEKLEALSEG